jgi:transposase InsO family protein
LNFGFQYILVLVNDASCFNRIYLLKAKSKSEKKILEFFAEIKNKLDQVPAYFHSDCGREFSSNLFLAALWELGVFPERGPADSPQTNGIAKRFNGVLLEKIKCMLLQSQVPQSMWHEAALHAFSLLNVLPL